MVDITKEEKEMLLERYPYLCVVRTMKKKSKRHHYCCEEHRGAMRYLEEIRAASTRHS